MGFPPSNHPLFILPPPGLAPDGLFMHHHPPHHPMQQQNEMRVRDGENNIEWNFEGDHFLNFQPTAGEGGYLDRNGPRSGAGDGSYRHFNDRRGSHPSSRDDGPPSRDSGRANKDKVLESRDRSRADSRSRDDYSSSKRGEIIKTERERSSKTDMKGERGNKERDYKESSSNKERDYKESSSYKERDYKESTGSSNKDRERDKNRDKEKIKESSRGVDRKGHSDKESLSRKRKSRSRSSSPVIPSKRKGSKNRNYCYFRCFRSSIKKVQQWQR